MVGYVADQRYSAKSWYGTERTESTDITDIIEDIFTYAVDVKTSRAPEEGAHSPCGQTGLLSSSSSQ